MVEVKMSEKLSANLKLTLVLRADPSSAMVINSCLLINSRLLCPAPEVAPQQMC